MCKDCDWRHFVEQGDDLISETEEIPERGADFADSVRQKIRGMQDWARENNHVTEKMQEALTNMRRGVEKWLM